MIFGLMDGAKENMKIIVRTIENLSIISDWARRVCTWSTVMDELHMELCPWSPMCQGEKPVFWVFQTHVLWHGKSNNTIRQSSLVSTRNTTKTFETLSGRIAKRITLIRRCPHLLVSTCFRWCYLGRGLRTPYTAVYDRACSTWILTLFLSIPSFSIKWILSFLHRSIRFYCWFLHICLWVLPL
jgi:hypothetical protein